MGLHYLKSLFFILIIIVSCSKTEYTEHACESSIPNGTRSSCSDYDVSAEEMEFLAGIIRKDATVIQIVPLYFGQDNPIVYHIVFDKGWAVVSGDKRTDIIIAEADEGSLDLNNPVNDNVGYWWEMTLSGLKVIKAKGLSDNQINEESLAVWDSIDDALFGASKRLPKTRSEGPETYWRRSLLGTTVFQSYNQTVNPIVETKWGKEEPWNSGFPIVRDTSVFYSRTASVSCSAVAAGQVIYHMHNLIDCPTGLYHSVSFSGNQPLFNVERADWVDNSPRWGLFAKTKPTPISNPQPDSVLFVRDFLADIGGRLGTFYYYEGSYSPFSSSSLSHFSLTCDNSPYSSPASFFIVMNNLTDNCPSVIVSSSSYFFPSYSTYHTWIIDGAKRVGNIVQYHYLWEECPGLLPNDGYYCYFTQEEAESYFFGHEEDLIDGAETWDNVDYTVKTYRMNWGDDGSGDDVEYSAVPLGWTHDNNDYCYSSTLFYNFRELD